MPGAARPTSATTPAGPDGACPGANTFSVVFSFCDEALPTTTFSFYFLFLV